MGNWNDFTWPKPWYQQAYEFLISAYVLPFTIVGLTLLLVLTFILVTGRKVSP